MKRIWSQCSKELAQFRRDRLTVALAFVLPVATLFIFSFAIRLETKSISLAVQDFDLSILSRTYIERLYATNQFQPTAWTGSNPVQAINQGKAKVAVVIPPDFSRRIRAGKTSSVQVLVDGTDVNNARVIANSIKATTNFFLQSSGLQPDTQRVRAQVRIWFNPGRKESLYIVPGVYAVILWIYPSLLAAIAMVREKEQGTILQIYASSISAIELILGKGLAYFLVGISEALAIIILGFVVFGIWFAGDPTPLLVGTVLFLSSSVLFGLLIGARTNTQSATVQAVATAGFLTALLLSGFIYPLSNIPFPLSLLTNVIPTRYYIQVTRDGFLRGTGWIGVWFSLLMLVVLSLLFLRASSLVLSRMQLPD